MGNQKKVSVSGIVHEQDTQKRNENYGKYVKEITPKNSIVKNTIKTYIIGENYMHYRAILYLLLSGSRSR